MEGKIKIGDSYYPTPPQGKPFTEVIKKSTNSIVLQWNVLATAGGAAQTITVVSQPTINLISPSNLIISNMAFSAKFTQAGGAIIRNATDVAEIIIERVNWNIIDAVSGNAIAFNSTQIQNITGYEVVLNTSNQFNIFCAVNSDDLGIAAFGAGDVVNFQGQMKLYY